MEGLIVAVIGSPGTGKSFLTKKLAEFLHAEKILEEDVKFPERILENFKSGERDRWRP